MQTQRLRFRPVDESDLPFLHDLLGWPEPLDDILIDTIDGRFVLAYPPAKIDDWPAKSRERDDRDGFSMWLGSHRRTGQPIGLYGPMRQTIEDESLIEIGWYTHRDHHRQGYAREAAEGWITWMLKSQPVDRLHAAILPANVPSIRTAQSVGMTLRRTGVTHAGMPHHLYAVDRADVERSD